MSSIPMATGINNANCNFATMIYGDVTRGHGSFHYHKKGTTIIALAQKEIISSPHGHEVHLHG